MQFTGKNLVRVRDALELAQSELHNMIATCPDVIRYEDEIAEYEAEKVEIQKIIDRIDRRGKL